MAQLFASHLKAVSQKPPEPPGTAITDNMIANHQESHPEIYHPDILFFEEKSDNPDALGLTAEITPAEYSHALKHTKNNSPGHDKILTQFLKSGGPSLNQRLLQIFNKCLDVGYFPPTWKHAVIRMIWKPGKDPSETRSYRPISLLPIPGKLFERVITQRLNRYLENNSHFSDTQHGFRQGRQTVDPLIRFSHDLAIASHHKDLFVPILFDAEKAFDRVWTEGLMFKLTRSELFPLTHSFVFPPTVTISYHTAGQSLTNSA